MIGKTILNYEILEKLGEGGMGKVFKALDTKLERFVGLKFLSSQLTENEEVKARFIQEAKAASAINHPNVCTIYDIQENDGQLFIVMEYIEGKELKEFIETHRNTSLQVNDVINYAIQIAEGLYAAHKKGIIHRDIKPSNIMITNEEKIKIMDFGLAKIKGNTQITKTREAIGTVAYMSPEQISGEEVDHRTDIWSYGIVLYEMLTGLIPFRSEYEAAIMYSIIHEDPKPILLNQDNISDSIQTIVTKTLQKNVNNRYQSMKEIIADMRNLLPDTSLSFVKIPTIKQKKIKHKKLPIQLTSFVGREFEISEIKKLLSASRLITLTGPGGTGKTRLALQFAKKYGSEFNDGVHFIELASVKEPKLITNTIAQAMDISNVGELSPLEALKMFLRDKQALLILDNFEQVISGAILITELLVACSEIKIVITSRIVLHLSGEQEFHVPPLSLPGSKQNSLEDLLQSEAVILFIQRAQANKPEFALNNENASTVADICIRLDGLPLAIELAAARIKILTPQMMLPRLKDLLKLLVGGPKDLPTRQQTLRGTIEWSYSLLDEDEKKLLRRLSVFAGGCTLETAELLSNATTDLGIDVLDGLASLVDKSLLSRSDQSRFFFLETIREFGMECLLKSKEGDLFRRAHRDFFLQFSEEAENHLTGSNQKEWLEKLDNENDNLRAAYDWSVIDNKNKEAVFRLGAALWRYWLIHGYLYEGREKLTNLIAMFEPEVNTNLKAKILNGAGTLAQNQADYPAAHSYFNKSLTMYRQLKDLHGIATALNNLGWISFRLGEYSEAKTISQEGLNLHQQTNNNGGIATSLNNLGFVAHHQGDYKAAEAYHRKSLDLRRQLGNKRSIAFSLSNLGWALQKQGNYTHALEMHEEALSLLDNLGDSQLFAFAINILAEMTYEQCKFEKAQTLVEKQSLPIVRKIGSKYGITFALTILGDVLLHQGEYNQPVKLHKECLELRKETNDKWCIAQSLHRLGEVARYNHNYEKAFSFYKESLILRQEMEDNAGIVECLEGIAELKCIQNKLYYASQLFGAASSLRHRINFFLSPCLKSSYKKTETFLHSKMINGEFVAAINQGKSMKLERAITLALLET